MSSIFYKKSKIFFKMSGEQLWENKNEKILDKSGITCYNIEYKFNEFIFSKMNHIITRQTKGAAHRKGEKL